MQTLQRTETKKQYLGKITLIIILIFRFNMAIAIDPNNHVLYSNRSAAYTNLGDFKAALQDANRVIQINPTWSRVCQLSVNCF